MNNKNSVIGTVLLGILLMAFFYISSNQMKEKAAKQAAEKAIAAKVPTNQAVVNTNTEQKEIAPTMTESKIDTATQKAKLGVFAAASNNPEKEITIETDFQKVIFSTHGGSIKSVELKKYKTWDKKPLILLNHKDNKLGFQFPIDGSTTLQTADLNFETTDLSESVPANGKKTISFKLKAGEGKYIEQTYTLSNNTYEIGYNVNMVGMNQVIPANVNFIDFNWVAKLASLEQNPDNERRYSALYFKPNEKVSHLDEDKEEVEDKQLSADWICYKQQFFNTSLFSSGTFKDLFFKSFHQKTDSSTLKTYTTQARIPFKNDAASVSYSMKFYFGPNEYATLAKTTEGLEEIIKLSPDFWLFHWIKYFSKFLIIPCFNLLDRLHINYGIIILLLTILIKLVITPLTWKTIKTSAYMRALKPEMDELKAKYGEDQQKMGSEQMKLTQKAGVNQFGGCLPSLLQIPIMMSLYYFFINTIELRQQPFLWATDLTSYDAIVTFGKNMPFGLTHISLFTILLTLTSLAMAWYQQKTSGMVNTQPGMQYMPYMMPFMLMFMFNSFPAALTYYYLLQNVLSIAQQWIMEKSFLDMKKIRAEIETNFKTPKSKSKWAQKLEDIQKQAEQQQKAKKK